MPSSIIDAVCTPPADGRGKAIGATGWRFVCELLIAAGGARVGIARVGEARVGDYQWLELDSFAGASWAQGSSSAANGWPRAANGVGTVMLDNANGAWSPLNNGRGDTVIGSSVHTATLWREFVPGAIVRLVMFKNGASTDATYVPNYEGGGDSPLLDIDRTDWQPLYTGRVESWDETELGGHNYVKLTLCETLAALVGYTPRFATAPPIEQQALIDRLERLLRPSSAGPLAWWDDDRFLFPITRGDRSAAQLLEWQNTVVLDETDATGALLAELYLSADSANFTELMPDSDGSLRVGLGPTVDLAALVDETPPAYSGAIVCFTTELVDEFATSDADYFPGKIRALIESPVNVAANSDGIVNIVQWQGDGFASGATLTSSVTDETRLSENRFGQRRLNRTGLLGINEAVLDAEAKLLNTGVLDPSLSALPGAAELDQSVTVSPLKITDQHTAQRALKIGNAALVDYRADSTDVTTRIASRITALAHTVTPTFDGVTWQTVATISRASTAWQPIPD